MPAPLPVDRRQSRIRLVRFTPDIDDVLRQYAADRGISVSALIRQATLDALPQAY